MTIPPIPTDFGQLSQWLIMPAVLALLANLVINALFSNADPKAQSFIRFGVFIVDGVVSYLLTKLSPDFVASIAPLWAILAAVIAAYYAPTVAQQIWVGFQLLGLRLLMGRDSFASAYKMSIKHPLSPEG